MTYTPRNDQENQMLRVYTNYLNNSGYADPGYTVHTLTDEMEYVRNHDLDEEGYSLVTQLTFELDQCPVSLIGFFDHVTPWNKAEGTYLTLLMQSADSSAPMPIYCKNGIAQELQTTIDDI